MPGRALRSPRWLTLARSRIVGRCGRAGRQLAAHGTCQAAYGIRGRRSGGDVGAWARRSDGAERVAIEEFGLDAGSPRAASSRLAVCSRPVRTGPQWRTEWRRFHEGCRERGLWPRSSQSCLARPCGATRRRTHGRGDRASRRRRLGTGQFRCQKSDTRIQAAESNDERGTQKNWTNSARRRWDITSVLSAG